MAAKRKKWQVRYRTTEQAVTFPSQAKAYAFLRERARTYFANPDTMDPRAYVYVDEGDSRGWQRYDDVMLSDWTEPAPAKEA